MEGVVHIISTAEISSAAILEAVTPVWKYVLNVVALVTRIVPPSLWIIPSPSATAVVPTVAPPSTKLTSAPVTVIAVPSKFNVSMFAVPSIKKSLNLIRLLHFMFYILLVIKMISISKCVKPLKHEQWIYIISVISFFSVMFR